MKKFSKNQITGKEYEILNSLNDQFAINNFLNANHNKPVVVVQGLGFVGAVMSLVCANALTKDYAVIGIDLANENTYWKICSINEGIFPVVASDPKIEQFYKTAKEKNNLLATFDPYAYSVANVIIVDINLDVKKTSNYDNELLNYDVDLTAFKRAIEAIGNNCKEDALILVETTVPPGTCQKIVKPIIDECLQKRGLSIQKYALGHSYERVMPGPDYINSIQNFYRVYSGIDEKSADRVEVFLKTIISTTQYPLTRLGNTNATEMAKVLENSYRAMNIAFAQEWSRFAEEAEVNIYEVVNAIRQRPTHANLMYPGIGVGGYCLTKDPLLASWAKQNLFNSKEALVQSETGVKINDKMPLFAFQYFVSQYKLSLSQKNVLLLGVSYRSDVGDTRYSPVEPFYNYMLNEKANITLHDPYVSFWDEKSVLVAANLLGTLHEGLDVIVISTAHQEYRKNDAFIKKLMSLNNVFIFDTVGLFAQSEIDLLKTKHTIKVLGRGDM